MKKRIISDEQTAAAKAKARHFFSEFRAFVKTKVFLNHFLLASLSITVLTGISLLSLNFYTQHGFKMSVPDFTGLTLEEAEELADAKNVQLKVIDSIFVADVPKGTVADQSPKPEAKVKKNRTIFVTMRTLMPEMIKMPDVTDVSLIQAKADLQSYGLFVTKLIYIEAEYFNHVFGQNINGKPAVAGTLVEKGTGVELIVGKGYEGSYTAVPILIGKGKAAAYQSATDYFLNIGKVVYDESVVTSRDSASARVFKQSLEPSDYLVAQLGTQITIWMTTTASKIDVAKISAEDERKKVRASLSDFNPEVEKEDNKTKEKEKDDLNL
ncbi:MAG TPA: penicillin-binding protein [Bacteroidales bacterium]|nr:penicillin-binding protein [Bacteroidales bacterium]